MYTTRCMNLPLDCLQRIHTPFAGGMLAQFLEQVVILLKASHIVKRQILLARRESGEYHISLATTCIFIVIAAEPNDTAAPHPGFFSSNLLHEFQYRKAIFTLPLIS